MLLVASFLKLKIFLFCFGKALDEFKTELFEIIMYHVGTCCSSSHTFRSNLELYCNDYGYKSVTY